MTLQELELLIKQGEGYNLEFKQSLPSKASDLAEEICAFANAAGGTLLIGVDDKGKIVGLSMDNTNRSRLQNVLNCIEPRIEVAGT
jgi:ATP-dependent DNA helicase RecG